jgi:hypothetical protein
MTPEERAERVLELLEHAAAVYRLQMGGGLDVDQARTALELLQLRADLIDLYDRLARQSQTR